MAFEGIPPIRPHVLSRMSRWINRTSGLVFIALGIRLATEKAH